MPVLLLLRGQFPSRMERLQSINSRERPKQAEITMNGLRTYCRLGVKDTSIQWLAAVISIICQKEFYHGYQKPKFISR